MNIRRCCASFGFALALTGLAVTAYAQQKEIKIGVIYDYTGPLAAGGSLPGAMGTKAAIEMINERGGIEGYRIKPTYADAQSKAEVAINEMTRLLDQEKVDLILGVFSSAHCVPMAQQADAKKKLMWATICVASSVVKDKNLTHFFRVQVHSDQYGETSCKFLNELSKAKLGKDPKDLKVAIIYEDGPYGAGVAMGNEAKCKALGMQQVLKEGYAATSPDLSSLITKLRRAQADVILHTGYNPDITKEMLKRYMAEVKDRKIDEIPPHVSMGFNQSWILFTDVIPRAIKKYGGIDPEALRKAALDTDIPVGGTIQGYGVKFFAPGTPMAGQNERSSPVVMQYIGGDTKIVWPAAIKTADPVLPLPKGHTYAR